ncbi:MAG: AraC family transcriptional regulator, partial [Bacteroidota bacterium]
MSDIIRLKHISDVHDFYGMEKPQHPLVSLIPINDKVANHDYGDFKYSFDFYQIILKEGVAGSLVYGRNSYDFQEGTILFLKPNQVVKVEDPSTINESKGWTLFF